MARSKIGAVCPPGIFCLTPGVILFTTVLLTLLIVGAFFIRQMDNQQEPLFVNRKQMFDYLADQKPPPPVQIAISRGGDDRYTRAPEPLRWWYSPMAETPVAQPPFGFASRGYPEPYQSYGFIMTENGQTLPLYGRRTAGRSDRYNYYTRTDTYNPIPVPIRYKGRDCQDSVGCEELFDMEKVKLVNGIEGKVNIYQYDGPAYNPIV